MDTKIGHKIAVVSATSDKGKTNNPNGWWGSNNITLNTPISEMEFKHILGTYEYQVVEGGYADGKLISTRTVVEITGLR